MAGCHDNQQPLTGFSGGLYPLPPLGKVAGTHSVTEDGVEVFLVPQHLACLYGPWGQAVGLPTAGLNV